MAFIASAFGFHLISTMPPHCNAEDVVRNTPSVKETRKLEKKTSKYLEMAGLQNFTQAACGPR